MSYITYSGYGYSKRICKDVTTWFLNKFLPRHKIEVEILHRGLRREGVYGYCDTVGESYRPREFLIELNTYMDEELYIKTLLHELVHLRQWVQGSLRMKRGKMHYGKIAVELYDYWHQPHEVEAREQEETLYYEYLRRHWTVSEHILSQIPYVKYVPPQKVAHLFPNRLMEAV